MTQEMKKQIKESLLNFIKTYQKSLWINNNRIFEATALITLNDLRYHLGFEELSYKDFKAAIDSDDDLSVEVQQFLTNNFIHYASSVKLKELLADYKDSIIKLDNNEFEFKMEEIKSFVSNQMKAKYAISLNCNDPKSDVDKDDADRILETVEIY